MNHGPKKTIKFIAELSTRTIKPNQRGENMTAKIQKPTVTRKRLQFFTSGPSMVQQQFQEEANINHIVAFHRKHGFYPNINTAAMVFEDLPGDIDYQEAMRIVMEANESFQKLGARIREKFDNDPAKFLDFATNNENHHEMVEMGLLNAPQEQQNKTSDDDDTTAVPAVDNPPKDDSADK